MDLPKGHDQDRGGLASMVEVWGSVCSLTPPAGQAGTLEDVPQQGECLPASFLDPSSLGQDDFLMAAWELPWETLLNPGTMGDVPAVVEKATNDPETLPSSTPQAAHNSNNNDGDNGALIAFGEVFPAAVASWEVFHLPPWEDDDVGGVSERPVHSQTPHVPLKTSSHKVKSQAGRPKLAQGVPLGQGQKGNAPVQGGNPTTPTITQSSAEEVEAEVPGKIACYYRYSPEKAQKGSHRWKAPPAEAKETMGEGRQGEDNNNDNNGDMGRSNIGERKRDAPGLSFPGSERAIVSKSFSSSASEGVLNDGMPMALDHKSQKTGTSSRLLCGHRESQFAHRQSATTASQSENLGRRPLRSFHLRRNYDITHSQAQTQQELPRGEGMAVGPKGVTLQVQQTEEELRQEAILYRRKLLLSRLQGLNSAIDVGEGETVGKAGGRINNGGDYEGSRSRSTEGSGKESAAKTKRISREIGEETCLGVTPPGTSPPTKHTPIPSCDTFSKVQCLSPQLPTHRQQQQPRHFIMLQRPQEPGKVQKPNTAASVHNMTFPTHSRSLAVPVPIAHGMGPVGSVRDPSSHRSQSSSMLPLLQHRTSPLWLTCLPSSPPTTFPEGSTFGQHGTLGHGLPNQDVWVHRRLDSVNHPNRDRLDDIAITAARIRVLQARLDEGRQKLLAMTASLPTQPVLLCRPAASSDSVPGEALAQHSTQGGRGDEPLSQGLGVPIKAHRGQRLGAEEFPNCSDEIGGRVPTVQALMGPGVMPLQYLASRGRGRQAQEISVQDALHTQAQSQAQVHVIESQPYNGLLEYSMRSPMGRTPSESPYFSVMGRGRDLQQLRANASSATNSLPCSKHACGNTSAAHGQREACAVAVSSSSASEPSIPIGSRTGLPALGLSILQPPAVSSPSTSVVLSKTQMFSSSSYSLSSSAVAASLSIFPSQVESPRGISKGNATTQTSTPPALQGPFPLHRSPYSHAKKEIPAKVSFSESRKSSSVPITAVQVRRGTQFVGGSQLSVGSIEGSSGMRSESVQRAMDSWKVAQGLSLSKYSIEGAQSNGARGGQR